MIKVLSSYFRLLSLDVVLGACVSTLFIAKCSDVTLPNIVVASLGVAVWIIYTIDHLLDGSKSNVVPLTLRHQFHQEHRKPIFIVLILMMVLGLVLVYQLPIQIIVNGMILVGGVVLYFVGLKLIGARPSLYKEPLVALAYAIGVFLGPVSLMQTIEYDSLIILFAIYALMAFVNLLMFSVYELEIDEVDKHTSLARYTGKKKATYLINASFVLLLILFGYQLIRAQTLDMAVVSILTMITVLAIVNYWKKVFRGKERYRILGDAVFYFPFIALI